MSIVILNGTPMWNIFTRKQVRGFIRCGGYKRVGVGEMSIFKVYITAIRPMLEYAIPVWQVMPGYLSDNIESLRKRALYIVFSYIDSYNSALLAAGLQTHKHRGSCLCEKYRFSV